MYSVDVNLVDQRPDKKLSSQTRSVPSVLLR